MTAEREKRSGGPNKSAAIEPARGSWRAYLWSLVRAGNPLYLAATKLRRAENFAFDRRCRTETEQPVYPEQLSLPAESAADALFYAATPVRDFRRVVRASGVVPQEFTFLDLGCGKGRALMLAQEFGFARVIGVEADRRLYEIAARNLSRWREQQPAAPATELVHQDARHVQLPGGNLFIYLFNPFHGALLDEVVARIARAARDPSRKLIIAYYCNEFAHQIDAAGAFERSDVRPLLPWRRPTISYYRPNKP